MATRIRRIAHFTSEGIYYVQRASDLKTYPSELGSWPYGTTGSVKTPVVSHNADALARLITKRSVHQITIGTGRHADRSP